MVAPESAAEFHGGLRPRPAEAFLSLRALVLSLGPDVVERVTDAEVTYARRATPFLRVRAVRSRLQLAFPPEVALEDPSGRLLKRGEEKFVAVEGPEGLDSHVQEFVRKAYATLRR